jgi:hypothetical protein
MSVRGDWSQGREHAMMRRMLGRGLLIAVLMASVIAGFGGGSASAGADTARLYVHTLKCSRNVDDLFEDCHNRRIAGFHYTLAGAERASDRNGTVKWGPGGPRTYRVDMNPMDYAAYTGGYLSCEDQTIGVRVADGPFSNPFIIINLQPGHVVFCDVYLYTD